MFLASYRARIAATRIILESEAANGATVKD
jgi:hypothetical protein